MPLATIRETGLICKNCEKYGHNFNVLARALRSVIRSSQSLLFLIPFMPLIPYPKPILMVVVVPVLVSFLSLALACAKLENKYLQEEV